MVEEEENGGSEGVGVEQELEGGAGQQIAEEEEERVAGGPARQLSSAHSLRAHRLLVARQQQLQ